MIGYKAFDKDLKCRGMQFEVGKTYETGVEKEKMELCTGTVIHFCRELFRIESESDYIISQSRVCEVIADGDIVTNGEKYGTNRITILRELTAQEKEDWSDRNTGNSNTGYSNTGDSNTGNRNTGNWNTGNWNTGDSNTGNSNTGDSNTGNRNTGNWNTGNSNTGYRNTGNSNTGDSNTGNRNTGNWNTGNWNTGNRNTGYFNTDSPSIRIFGKSTDKTIEEINFPEFLYFDLTVWVSHDTATEEEKEAHKKEIETSGGFLKKLGYKEAFRIAWDKAPKEEHRKLLDLPNWNNDIFKEISGIDAEAEIKEEARE